MRTRSHSDDNHGSEWTSTFRWYEVLVAYFVSRQTKVRFALLTFRTITSSFPREKHKVNKKNANAVQCFSSIAQSHISYEPALFLYIAYIFFSPYFGATPNKLCPRSFRDFR